MVLFDKGDQILKSVDFQKAPEEWIRQLETASDVPDRADAAVALGELRDNLDAANALGEAARQDKFWGVREEALRALGHIHSPTSLNWILAALSNKQPWVRQVAVEELGRFHNDEDVAKKLRNIYKDDKAYSVRGSALQSLADDKASGTAELLEKVLDTASPDNVLQQAALRAMGSLGDDSVVPSLIKWSSPGNASLLRGIAIGSLGRVDLKNHDITARLISYLNEPSFDIRFACIFALGRRGDPSAIEPLETLLKAGTFSIGVPHSLEGLIDELKAKNGQQKDGAPTEAKAGESSVPAGSNQEVLDRLDQLERQISEMNNRLRR
ncbi:MAG: HEAT repeat domain-containing protein, partial [Candidatus Acidiferrales bacterium]